jgi:hypothetical protein
VARTRIAPGRIVSRLAALAVLVALLVPAATAQALVIPRGVEWLARGARSVVVARVAAVTPRWSPSGEIVSDVALVVDRRVTGSGASRVRVTVPGGQMGDLVMAIDEAPRFVPGERCVLFLDAAGRVVADRQGKLDVVFNDSFAWGDASIRGGVYDIASVAIHELGRSLSLDDQYGSGDSGKVMYGYGQADHVHRTLSLEDAKGIAYIFGWVTSTPVYRFYNLEGRALLHGVRSREERRRREALVNVSPRRHRLLPGALADPAGTETANTTESEPQRSSTPTCSPFHEP